jgi:hypothetical protein
MRARSRVPGNMLLLLLVAAAAAAPGPRRAPLLDLELRRVRQRAADSTQTLALARAIEFTAAYEPTEALPRDAADLLRRAETLRAELADECRAAAADDACLDARWDAEYDMCFVHRTCAADAGRTAVECTDDTLDAALAQAALADTEAPSTAVLAERACSASATSTVGFLAHFDAANGTCGQIDIGASAECRARFAAHPLAHHAPWLAALRALQSTRAATQ